MRGDPIASVELGIKAWHTDVLCDPSMIEEAAVSLITFGGIAKQASKLTDVMEFQVPPLTAGGSPCLGAALEVLTEAINVEVMKGTCNTKGDWKPMVFVFTAGAPDEIWKPAAHELKRRYNPNILVFLTGSVADRDSLRDLTEYFFYLNEVRPGFFGQFFKWVSSSAKLVQSEPLELPPVSLSPSLATHEGMDAHPASPQLSKSAWLAP
jgi:uncharacterized protein YegL